MEEQNAPLKKKKVATQSQIGKELKQIYAAGDGNDDADMSTIVRAQKKRRWPVILLAVVALFALAAVAWAGIMRFGGQVRYGNNINLEITGPAAPRAGEVGVWTIHYQNDERLPLAQASLALQIPNSMTVLSSDPQRPDAKSLTWQIGTVSPGASGDITVKARILDAVDAPLAVTGVLSYRPANFNADFQKIADWSSRIADAAVDVTLAAPDESVPGDSETFTIAVARRADLTADALVPDLKIRFDPNQFVVVKTATPNFSSTDQRTWVATAPTDKPLQFTVTGSFAAGVAGDTQLKAEVGTLGAGGDFLLLASSTATVKVMPGDLTLTLIRNGSTADSTIDLGAPLHVSVDYENQSAKPITDAEIALTAAGTPSVNGANTVDWATLDDLRNGKRAGNTIIWTKKEIPELAAIPAGAKGSIDLSFKTASSAFTLTDRLYAIDLSARGLIGSIGGKPSGKTVSTPVLRTLVNTDATIAAAVKQIDGALPPKVGQPTSYRVVWALTNSLHELSGIKVTAQLPTGVTFLGNGNVNAGDLHYDGGANAVTWTLNRLPTSVKSLAVDFNVSITPGNGQIGKSLPLLGDTMLNATDKDTNAALADDARPLDTASVEGGPDNAGIVQP